MGLVQEAADLCRKMTAQSGSNFYYAFLFLPPQRREAVRVAGGQREAGAAVLERDPGVAGHEPAAEAHVVRLDERARVAIAVDDGQVDRPARPGDRARRRCHGALGPDPRALRREVAGREQPLERRGVRVRVGDVRLGVDEPEPHRFDERMKMVDRAPGRPPGVAVRACDAQRDERRQALSGRRALVDAHRAVVDVDGGHPAARVAGQIVRRQPAARRLDRPGDRGGERTAVERVAAAVRHGAQAAPEGGQADDVAGAGRAAGR
jgi:hypothetical protein